MQEVVAKFPFYYKENLNGSINSLMPGGNKKVTYT